jgi:hypothetical protein
MAKAPEIPFPARSARFRQVVDRCGRPDVHLSLIAPARDRELQDLARRGRVLTVRQAHRGQGTDHGVVGVFPGRRVQFLVFARSLKTFSGKRIVGIDYSLLHHPSRATAEKIATPRWRTTPAGPAQGRRTHARDREQIVPPPPAPESPPGPVEIKTALRRILSLLTAKRYVRARAQIQALLERMDAS